MALVSLYTLLQSAHKQYVGICTTSQTTPLQFSEWCTERAGQSVNFSYWLKTLDLQLLLFLLVRSLREGNFDLYVETMIKVMPWMFALDRTNYARWLPVHVRDMLALPKNHPSVHAAFSAGMFVVHKTRNKFSAIALDHAHEQMNDLVKGSGGAVGLTQDPGALRRWMIAGPEVARVITEFESDSACTSIKDTGEPGPHHTQLPGVQQKFKKDVKSLTSVFEELGNPFLEESQELLVLDTKDIMDQSVVNTVNRVVELGQEQYTTFIQERLLDQTKRITDPLPRNQLPLFSTPASKRPAKGKLEIASLKNDCNLFSRLYVACQTRDGDLDGFFSHENQSTPPSLSQYGKLRPTNKAALLTCLETDTTTTRNAPSVEVKMFDGAAIVQMLQPKTARTFQDYAEQVFVPYISNQLQGVHRADIIWDSYLDDSLKASTRERRGKGLRRRVLPAVTVPKSWRDFLRINDNKTELFAFLSEQSILHLTSNDTVLYATCGRNVLCSTPTSDLSQLSPCLHEEADTRIFVHVADAVRQGYLKISIRTVDTDVVVIAVAAFNKIHPEELWLAFGTGDSFRYIAIHELVKTMTPRKCAALPIFHAITGCDTVSAFNGRGKKSAWQTWNVYSEVTSAFEELSQMNNQLSETAFSQIERFVILLYDRTSDITEVDEARKVLFTRKSRSLENIPPTRDALKQHLKRASYQSYLWIHADVAQQQQFDPANFGWTRDTTGWQPLWTTIPQATQSCYELIHCGCKKGCHGRCKCVKAALKCTALCACSGECRE